MVSNMHCSRKDTFQCSSEDTALMYSLHKIHKINAKLGRGICVLLKLMHNWEVMSVCYCPSK